MSYDFTVRGLWDRPLEWLPDERKFDVTYQGWDFVLSQTGYEAKRKIELEPLPPEIAEIKKKVDKIANQFREGITYRMYSGSGRSTSKASPTAAITGPGKISLEVDIMQTSVKIMVYGPPPASGDILKFVHSREENKIFNDAVTYYLKALDTDSETEIAVELYKSFEVLEGYYDSKGAALNALGLSKVNRKDLKWNLNLLRHPAGKFKKPLKKLSLNECLVKIKEVIERFRAKEGL